MTKIINVEQGSIADECGIVPGDCLVSVNGKEIKDILEFKFLTNDLEFVIEIQKLDGTLEEIEVYNEYYEDFGVEFENALMTKARSCANKCVFCFIDQLPEGMRETLYFKDDDSRLSFLQGNYITMTNLSDKELNSIVGMRMSPINVSVHCTNPELRSFMLGNKNAGKLLEQMKKLADAGIIMNCQIVLCPGINDGEVLDKTLTDLSELIPHVFSISVVPVGITKYRDKLYELKSFTKETSEIVINQVNKWQEKFLDLCGKRLLYASDEFYIMAEKEFPPYENYEDFPQLENGVGMISLTEDEFMTEIEDDDLSQNKDKVSIVTGKISEEFIKNLVSKIKNVDCKVFGIKNNFFGEKITVSGLVTASDIIEQLKNEDIGDVIYIPVNMLRRDTNVFLDDLTTEDVETALGVKVKVIADGTELAKELLNRKEV